MDCLESKMVKIRKPARCFGCSRVMPTGSIMRQATWVDQGEFLHSKLCGTCKAHENKIIDTGDYYDEGELKDGDPGLWESTRAEIEG